VLLNSQCGGGALNRNRVEHFSAILVVLVVALIMPCVYSEYNNVSIFHSYHQTSPTNYFINNRINLNNKSLYLTNQSDSSSGGLMDRYPTKFLSSTAPVDSAGTYECSLCRQREQMKELSLQKIKELVLKKLGFGDTPPVRKKYPKLPSSIIQNYYRKNLYEDAEYDEMQSDDPNSSRNFVYHTTNKEDNEDIDNEESSNEFDDLYSKDRLYAFPVSKCNSQCF
jgi:hypothetical protein